MADRETDGSDAEYVKFWREPETAKPSSLLIRQKPKLLENLNDFVDMCFVTDED